VGVRIHPIHLQPGSPSTLIGGMLLSLLVTTTPALAADKSKSEALSIDDLFGGPPPAPTKPGIKTEPAATPPAPESPAATQTTVQPAAASPLATDTPLPEGGPELAQEALQPSPAKPSLTGFYQNDLAYTYAGKKHWSRFNNTLDLATQGSTDGGVAWKLGGRLNYDPIYDLTDYYPSAVRDDQRFEAMIREAYLDFSAGDWDFRLGRQHIVWGEMVGLFFADVVSARDMRQFLLPDFDMIRIPQWAARAEYFSGDFHAEAVWIPSMSYEDIGKPGAEFYPFKPPAVPGYQTVFAKEDKPSGLDESGYGARFSWIKDGWDVSGFYYVANDPAAAFSRQISLNTITYQPIHERIHQLGATLGKDLGPMVLKAEAVYARDKLFSTLDPLDGDGLVKQDFLDYIVGLEWSFPQETRFNLQLFQRWFPDHDAGIVPDSIESGVSLLLSTQALHPRLEPELLLISSLNRADWLAQFKLTWKMDGNWRLATGVDIFEGPATGLFGTYDDNDRVYTEVRYTF
jgi:hypothetical protein